MRVLLRPEALNDDWDRIDWPRSFFSISTCDMGHVRGAGRDHPCVVST